LISQREGVESGGTVECIPQNAGNSSLSKFNDIFLEFVTQKKPSENPSSEKPTFGDGLSPSPKHVKALRAAIF
jgi:hypothetical protein